MRTKDQILKEVAGNTEYNPRGGIVPDLADVLMIELLIDIRDNFGHLITSLNTLASVIEKKD